MKLSALEEIQLKKRQVERQQEDVEDLMRDVRKTEETYEEYFFYQQQLFEELQEEFSQSETDLLYQDMAEAVHWQKRHVQGFLEEQEQQFKQQSRSLEDQCEDLVWEQKNLDRNEKEEKHEY